MYDVGILSLPKSFVMSCLLSMPVSVAAFAGVLNVINNSNPVPCCAGEIELYRFSQQQSGNSVPW